MKAKSRSGFIYLNSPVILGLALISLILLILNGVTNNFVNRTFSIYFTSFKDPMMYLRMFTHVLCHQNMAHYANNFLLMLAVGPMVEEKYGSKTLLMMSAGTAFITGLIHAIFFHNVMLLGASGLVFMMILLASFTNMKNGGIPVTVILVGVLYIGNEVINAFASNDNISQLAHIIGGLCGAIFGYVFHKGYYGNRRSS